MEDLPQSPSIYSDGWRPTADGADVVDPATRQVLGRVGVATARDIAPAAASARAASRSWFAQPYEERAAVIRKAADLLEQRAGDYTGWIVRETGSVAAKAGFEIMLTHEASWEKIHERR